MADISKINGVPIANIEKLDAVLAANIAKVNGLVFSIAPAFTGLLDTYTGAAAGYSTRRLASSATVLMRVRRETAGGTGDDDEADVAYDSNNELSLDSAISNASAGVTATTLGQFLNVGTVNGTTYTNPDSLTVTASCFVDTWYDQSGNANHAEQTAQGSQPQIHSGTVNTDLITENGKPSIEFDDVSMNTLTLPVTGTVANATGVLVRTAAGMPSSHEGTAFNYKTFGITYGHKTLSNYRNAVVFRNTRALRLSTYPTTDEQALDFFVATEVSAGSTNSDVSIYRNATAGDSGLTLNGYGVGANLIGAWSTQYFRGGIQELLIWESDQGTNRPGIEQNINTDYLIYQPTDAPTSGLLATYTGAAAAYSVRQLSDKAVICMRIRRDSDDEETNIGWDANGDLDTTAISDFCSTANGYVTRWWDQSTNGNHADQPVGGTGSNTAQPQIYNGTSVITENGKPCLKIVNDYFVLSPTLSLGSSMLTVVSCHKGASFQETLTWDQRLYYRGSGLITLSANTSINGSVSGISTQNLITAQFDSVTSVGRFNGTQFASGSTGTTGTIQGVMSRGIGLQTTPNATVQEMIKWPTWNSGNTSNMESDVMTYFQIP